MVVFLLILDYLTLENATLYAVKSALPKGNIIHTSIYCTTDEKAAVMREMSTAVDNKNIEFIDGLRICEDTAWVLMLPDASHPLIHLYGEGKTTQERDAIIEKYSQRIKNFLTSV